MAMRDMTCKSIRNPLEWLPENMGDWPNPATDLDSITSWTEYGFYQCSAGCGHFQIRSPAGRMIMSGEAPHGWEIQHCLQELRAMES